MEKASQSLESLREIWVFTTELRWIMEGITEGMKT